MVVFAKGDLAEAAKAAGADDVGEEELAKKIKDGWTDFDVCIAAPDMMGSSARWAKCSARAA